MTDSSFGPNARFNLPSGLLWINGLGLLISDTGNNSIRLATNNPAYGAENYMVFTFAGMPGTPGFANGTPRPRHFGRRKAFVWILPSARFWWRI